MAVVGGMKSVAGVGFCDALGSDPAPTFQSNINLRYALP
jgi:hypothetical protein